MSIDAAACVIDGLGMAPPRKAASAEPSASMSTAACWVASSGEKSSYVTPWASSSGPTKYSNPAPGTPTVTRRPARSASVSTPDPGCVMKSATLGANVITERTG